MICTVGRGPVVPGEQVGGHGKDAGEPMRRQVCCTAHTRQSIWPSVGPGRARCESTAGRRASEDGPRRPRLPPARVRIGGVVGGNQAEEELGDVRRRAVEVSGRPAGGEELGESGAERGRAGVG